MKIYIILVTYLVLVHICSCDKNQTKNLNNTNFLKDERVVRNLNKIPKFIRVNNTLEKKKYQYGRIRIEKHDSFRYTFNHSTEEIAIENSNFFALDLYSKIEYPNSNDYASSYNEYKNMLLTTVVNSNTQNINNKNSETYKKLHYKFLTFYSKPHVMVCIENKYNNVFLNSATVTKKTNFSNPNFINFNGYIWMKDGGGVLSFNGIIYDRVTIERNTLLQNILASISF